jgi:hypothetical protein
MADQDEPFNSSDMEFDGQPEDDQRRTAPGKRAMASIVAQSVTDRVASKKAVKTLKDAAMTPGTAWAREYWLNLFTEYANVTLHIEQRAK